MDQCAESAIDWEITTNKLSLPIERNLHLGLKKSRLRVWVEEVSNQVGGFLWVSGVIQDIGITLEEFE